MECRACGRRIYSMDERARGTCSGCFVSTWSPSKREAVDLLIGVAFRGEPAENIDRAYKIAAAAVLAETRPAKLPDYPAGEPAEVPDGGGR